MGESAGELKSQKSRRFKPSLFKPSLMSFAREAGWDAETEGS